MHNLSSLRGTHETHRDCPKLNIVTTMRITSEKNGQYTILMPSGRMGFEEAEAAQELFTKALETAESGIVCDCAGLDYISSAGLRVFLVVAKAAEQRGLLFVACRLNDHVSSVFKVTGFDRIIQIHDSVESALNSSIGTSKSPNTADGYA